VVFKRVCGFRLKSVQGRAIITPFRMAASTSRRLSCMYVVFPAVLCRNLTSVPALRAYEITWGVAARTAVVDLERRPTSRLR
jgi:hypothetical protein